MSKTIAMKDYLPKALSISEINKWLSEFEIHTLMFIKEGKEVCLKSAYAFTEEAKASCSPNGIVALHRLAEHVSDRKLLNTTKKELDVIMKQKILSKEGLAGMSKIYDSIWLKMLKSSGKEVVSKEQYLENVGMIRNIWAKEIMNKK